MATGWPRSSQARQHAPPEQLLRCAAHLLRAVAAVSSQPRGASADKLCLCLGRMQALHQARLAAGGVIAVEHALGDRAIELADRLANGLGRLGLGRRLGNGLASLGDVGAHGGLDRLVARASLLLDADALLGRPEIGHAVWLLFRRGLTNIPLRGTMRVW